MLQNTTQTTVVQMEKEASSRQEENGRRLRMGLCGGKMIQDLDKLLEDKKIINDSSCDSGAGCFI